MPDALPFADLPDESKIELAICLVAMARGKMDYSIGVATTYWAAAPYRTSLRDPQGNTYYTGVGRTKIQALLITLSRLSGENR
jgi:hypothetical protein